MYEFKKKKIAEMAKNKLNTLAAIILVVLLCFLFSGLIILFVAVPQQAAVKFGPASQDLTQWEHFYYSVKLYLYEEELKVPNSALFVTQNVSIEYGESVQSIGQKFYDLNLINNIDAFVTYLAYSGLDRTIQAGEYRIEPGRSAIEIAAEIQDATPSEITFVILAGWRLEEIARSLPTSGLSIEADKFLENAHHPSKTKIRLPLDWPEGKSLEGIFLPGTYSFPRDTSLEEFIQFFVDQFDEEIGLALNEHFNKQGLAVFDAAILASIVEKEAVVQEEQPLIASVFLNRLKAGMRLESDPTVQYALGFSDSQQGWWKNPLSYEDLSIDSLYNTYIHFGLPPGPICSPSLTALRSVAFPAQTSYLYFRSSCDESGSHNFANTYEEHLNNDCGEKE